MPLSPGFIGILDSGVGGLAVHGAVRELLADENLVYIADSGYAPYGDQPPGYVAARVEAIVAPLVALGAKAIVLACNTATVTAVATLRARYALPIVGIEPAIKPAAAFSAARRILVLATQRTAESTAVAELCARHGAGAEILVQACPGLADLVEAGRIDGKETAALLGRYLAPAMAARVDTVVLGCTHFTFLEAQMRRLLGADITFMEPSRAVARQLARRLPWRANGAAGAARERFYTTALSVAHTATVMTRLLAREVLVESAEVLGLH